MRSVSINTQAASVGRRFVCPVVAGNDAIGTKRYPAAVLSLKPKEGSSDIDAVAEAISNESGTSAR
jgi:hypothetical protein